MSLRRGSRLRELRSRSGTMSSSIITSGSAATNDVKARLAGAQSELERAARHARDELEEPGALARGFRQHLRIGPDDDVLRANAVRRPRARAACLLRGGGPGSRAGAAAFGRSRPSLGAGGDRRSRRGRLGSGQGAPAAAGPCGSRLGLGAHSGSSNGHRLGRSELSPTRAPSATKASICHPVLAASARRSADRARGRSAARREVGQAEPEKTTQRAAVRL